jgi:hypothetical protein
MIFGFPSARAVALAGISALSLMLVSAAAAAAEPAPRTALPPIRHVFIIVLENQAYEVTFGDPSPAPYLSKTLAQQGAMLPNYYGIGHASLDNYVALISGQAPNPETQSDCRVFSEFELSQPQLNTDGQALGKGCVYPRIVPTLPDQLEAAGLSWKGYMEDMGNDPQRESRACGHPAIGAPDRTLRAQVGDQYAAKHNPFVYFHSLIDDRTRCNTHVVNLSRLPQDLHKLETTPNYVFITPNLCNDGHDAPCVNQAPGGLVSANAFLKKWAPLITGSPAFKKDGLLIVTFDESDGRGADGAAACCGERPLPGVSYPPGVNGPGGGRVGAVLLSRFIQPGTASLTPYNHYSLLRSVEDLFGLDHLGYAAATNLRAFGDDLYTRPVSIGQ